MSETTKPATCHDDYDPNSLVMDEALKRIESAVKPITGYERVSVRDALDRVLAEDVLSTINVPAYTNSAMDGYAVKGSDLPADGEKTLAVIGKAFAGHPFAGEVQTGQCVRIMTGAPIPSGADTVIMQEHVTAHDNSIVIDARHKAGQNVRMAGEDMAIGAVALPAGKKVTPADMGLIASLGIAEIAVKRRLRAAFFSTGDELRSLGESLHEGQIYDSNRYTLYGMIKRMGIEIVDMGVIPDNRDAIRTAFERAAASADVVITTGGVSVGEADFIKQMLDDMGQVNFWKIAMKPGRPLTFGTLHNAYFFGLPGNPVSAMVTFYQYVKPALLRLAGQQNANPVTIRLRTISRLKKSPGRVEFQRGIITRDSNGEWVVQSTGHQGSHILSSMSLANCFIVLPMDMGLVEPGTWVDVQPFEGII